MKITFLSLFIAIAASTMVGCDKLNDITKSPLEKFMSDLTHEWTVDTMRVIEYAYLPGTPPQTLLSRDSLYPVTNMVFTANEVSAEGVVMQTTLINGSPDVKEIHWRYVDEISIDLVYYNPNTYTYNVSVRYDITELTDKSFRLYRYENLVSEQNGAKYGELKKIIRLHR